MSRDDYRSNRDSRDDRGRDRDDSRGSSRERDRDDSRETRGRDGDRDDGRNSRDRDSRDDRGRDRDRGGSSGYTYERRDDSEMRRRATQNSKFDKYITDDIKTYKPRDGANHVRILPPTWPRAKHYGYDIAVHYGVGTDRQTYLCLEKMRDEADIYFERNKMPPADGRDPVEEEAAQLRRDGYEKEAKEASRTGRVGVYVIDRKAESEGVQFWAMPQTMDREIVQHSINKRTGVALAIDDPEDGYDVYFDKTGKEKNTKYTGVDVDRDPSPLGNSKWLQWAMDHPIPDELIFYPYDHIAKMLGGGGGHHNARDNDDDRGRDSRGDHDRGRDDRDRDGDRSSRDSRDDGRRGQGREEDSGRDSRRDYRGHERDADRRGDGESTDGRRNGGVRGSSDEPTWDGIHGMRRREMEDLIEDRRLDIKPNEAKDDDDLADWICEELKISKPQLQRRSVQEDPSDERRKKLDEMRNRRD